jgi:hypothetical protein
MALAQKFCGSALSFDGLLNRERIIGFIGINFARLIGNNRRSDIDIGLVGRRRLDIADDTRVLVRGDMAL